MADDTLRSLNVSAAASTPRRVARSLGRFFEWFEARFPFGSVTRRIVILNLFGLAILVSGILFLNQFRAGLMKAKVQSLLTQGEIIARSIASSAAIETGRIALDHEQALELDSGKSHGIDADDLASLEFPINPERAAPILREPRARD